jgi:hypothetical protein
MEEKGEVDVCGELVGALGCGAPAETAVWSDDCGNTGRAYASNLLDLSLVQKRLASDAPFCHNPFNGRHFRILPVRGRQDLSGSRFMSLYGKILAVLNIFGAAAFVYFAFADFAKRESWAYTNYVYDVVVAGLPLDDTEKDNRESPVVNYLTDETKTEWFGADKVSTQIAEVDRVKNAINAKVDAQTDSPAQTVELARILTPFARHNDEREYLIALRTYLATPQDVERLNKRLHDAFPTAVQAYQTRPDDLKFPQAFQEATRALGGAPAQTFEQTFLKLLPAKPERTFELAVADAQKAPADPKNPEQEAHNRAEAFLRNLRDDPKATLRNLRDDPAKVKDTLDDLFQQTLAAVHAQLKAQLDELFDEARNGPKSLSNPSDRLRESQRVAIAHLLFNTVDVLQEGMADKGVIGSPAYGRVLSVVGLTAGLREINAQAALLQHIGEELEGSRTLERGEFTAAHRASIDELQGRAVVLHDALDLLTRKNQALDKEEETVRKRQDDVKKYEEDLAAARAKTDKQITELRKQSDALEALRIQGRDVLSENLDLERQIRSLEKNR